MKVAAEALQFVCVFRDLDIEQRQKLADSMLMKRFERESMVVAQDDHTRDVFFILSGKVRATVYSSAKKAVSFQDLGAGEMFGELSAIDGEPRSTDIVTLEESVIASLSQEAYWDALLHYPQVARQTLQRLTGLIRRHSERIFEYSTLGVKNRIHAELLRLARRVSDTSGAVEIPDPPTHAEIASRLATHREAVTRECKRLEELGLIEWRPGRHVINDVTALAQLVSEVRVGHGKKP